MSKGLQQSLVDLSQLRKDLSKEYRIKQKITEDLKRWWKKEYVLQLCNYHEMKRPPRGYPKFRVGDVALLQEDTCPRQMWNTAPREKVHQGRDGKTTAILRLPDRNRISQSLSAVRHRFGYLSGWEGLEDNR
jgi:hypothetical protein